MFNFGLFTSFIPYLVLSGMFALYFLSSFLAPFFQALPVTGNESENRVEVRFSDETKPTPQNRTFVYETSRNEKEYFRLSYAGILNHSKNIFYNPWFEVKKIPASERSPGKVIITNTTDRAPPADC